MKPPVCGVCGSEHWGKEHVFKGDVKPLHEVLRVAPVVDKTKMVVDKQKEHVLVVDSKSPVVPLVVDKSRNADRHKGDRTEYFREQKRRKRASSI